MTVRPAVTTSPTDDARPAPTRPTVVVVGNGAAGTLVVIELLRAARAAAHPVRIVWVGDGPVARGVAYATTRPWHRINVPADSLSLDGAERDFPTWLADRSVDVDDPRRRGHTEPAAERDDEFVPRWTFGAYLADTLLDVRTGIDPALVDLVVEQARAVGTAHTGGGVRIELADGRTVHGDRAVLALGPFSPARPPGVTDAALEHPGLVTDPWGGDLDDAAPTDRPVVLLGSGLTAVDVAMSLARDDRRVRLLAVSRSGLLPRGHSLERGVPLEPRVPAAPDVSLDRLVDAVETQAARHPRRWRDVVDGLRPVTQDLWRALTPPERDRFLAEHARRWEIHRHRMAPAVSAEVDHLCTQGSLEVRAAEIREVDVAGPRLRVRLADPARSVERSVDVDRVVSCVGSQDDVTAVDDPLVRSLLASGAARPHPSGLGFATADDGSFDPVDDRARRLFTLGALRRGDLYETTAVPEIREQATALARTLVALTRAG